MDSMNQSDRDGAERAASLKLAAAVVAIGLIVAAAEGSFDRARAAPARLPTLAAAVAPAGYFPAQFDVRPGAAESHVEAF